jgi:hypothetical protein
MLSFRDLPILCTNCTSASKIRQTVKEQGKKLIWAQSIVDKPKLNDDDFDNMKNFNRSAAADFNNAGKALKIQIGNYISFYKTPENQISMQDDKGGVENVYTFLANFIKHSQKDETFRSSLVICMMKGYEAKCEGSSNHPYGAKVLNFMLVLAASGNQ